ncbi:hypothetical protein Rin_00003560 [Candidatus Regiella insecticola 5.15]|uniref:Uncharacterized protein n=1 Tax=Candidatus Regiella insecticola 5.15 TaxID=1005043 RepID=G2GX67_9ENTR|nr:hypothetical protein Rin_00003560 [Candidatus Regiella insecticola 5.15]
MELSLVNFVTFLLIALSFFIRKQITFKGLKDVDKSQREGEKIGHLAGRGTQHDINKAATLKKSVPKARQW